MDSLKKALFPLIRPLGSLIILAVFLLHAIGYWNIGLFNRLEQIAYDIRINMTLPKEGDPQILIIDIDEDSLREIGQFPWPREYVAELLYILFGEYGISTLGFDIVFPEPDRRGAMEVLQRLMEEKPELTETISPLLESMDGDRQLAELLSQTPAVMGFYLDRESEEKTPSVGVLPDPLPINSPMSPKLLPIPKAERFSGNQPIHQANALTAGFFDNPLVDQDGVFRRVPMIQERSE
ncbi:CHASE2 domain-containing protein, partial [Oceanospirillum sp. HFRX-1_2]